ncbi:hypothetical protein ACJZ2D_008699 [Fusarium nematophilum]
MKSHSIVCPLLLGTQALASPSLSSFVESRSSSLAWKTCDLDLPDSIKGAMREPGDCATLEVPLDYTNKDSGKTIELQLIRFNATKEPFKGSVLWNPGGPGISGIETLAYLGPDFRDILGGHHHIISWDARTGVSPTVQSSARSSRRCSPTELAGFFDSNSLADAYLSSTGIGGPRDAEKSLNYFLSECVEVGTELCRLADYSGPDTTAQDLRSAVDDLFEKLVDEELPADSGLSPIEFPHGGNSILQKLKYAILNDLAWPSTYPTVVEILAYALEGNYKKALSLYSEAPSEWNLGTEAFSGIACSDSSFRVESADELYSMYRAHLAESTFGDAIAADYMGCSVWRFTAAEGVNTNELRNVNTSYPILVVNGAYDPVTSLTHAWQVSSRFRGSRMLVHEGIGHGVTSHASNCTLDAIAAYFQEGTLPEVGTVCKPNMLAFEYSKWLQEHS